MPPGTDTYFYGYIPQGTKFGATVEDARLAAQAILAKQGFRFAGTADWADTNLRSEIGCSRGAKFDAYHKHRGLGYDTVFLEVREERVAMIGWSIQLLQIDS